MPDALGAADEATQTPTAHQAAVARAGRVGRRAGVIVYLTALGYITVVGFGTFIDGVFGETPADGYSIPQDVPCDEARRNLADALRESTLDFLSSGDVPAHTAFLAHWDHRYGSIRHRCEDPATRELEHVRHRVELQARRFERENGTAIRRLGTAQHASNSPEPSR